MQSLAVSELKCIHHEEMLLDDSWDTLNVRVKSFFSLIGLLLEEEFNY